MDIYTYLKKDHRFVSDLMEEVVATSNAAKRQSLFMQIKQELTLHADTEEMTFYKEVDKASRSKQVHEKIEHADEEHDEIREYLEKLSSMSVSNDAWLVQFGEFKHSVAHHVKEEETELFEKAKKYLSKEDAVRLAKEMDALKQQAKSRLAAA